MNTFHRKSLVVIPLVLCFMNASFAQQNAMQFMSAASAKVAKAAGLKSKWDGPTTGPAIKNEKKIIFIANDLSDAGTNGVFNGMKEAAAKVGWQILTIDCRGRCNQGASVVKQALDMKADGIVLAGVDAAPQTKGLVAATAAKIPVVGWHASTKSGVSAGLFTNLTTDPKDVAQIAALYGVVESNNNNKAGIVVFTDTSNPYISAKSAAIIETVKQCENCRLLGVEDVALSDARKKFQPSVESLLKRHGAKWTHVIGVNDLYFDLFEKPEIAALVAGNKLRGISAGDGSATAFKRIRANALQIGTVPEPLLLHGWQLVDELNRAFSKVPPSGYVAPLHLVTSQNIAYDGGAKNVFDPSNEFRAKYLAFWGK